MAIAHEGSQTAITGVGGSVTELTISLPAASAYGYFGVIGVILSNGNAQTWTLPTGWTEHNEASHPSGGRISVWYKFLDNTEGGAVTVQWTNPAEAAIGISNYSGVNGADPIDKVGSFQGWIPDNKTTCPGITTGVNNAGVICIYGAAGANALGTNWGLDASYTEIYDVYDAGGTRQPSVASSWRIKASSGSTGSGVFAASNATTDYTNGTQFSLKSGTPPSPPPVTTVARVGFVGV